MKSTPQLLQYQAERGQLLDALLDLLQHDPAVRAAWLFGSMGRGDEDALSDLDLWVVVEDGQFPAILADPRAWAARVGQPVLWLEVPQNAPQGGAYGMTCYPGAVAPLIVDWYWQPCGLAHIPGEVRLLFERAAAGQADGEKRLERRDSPPHFGEGQPLAPAKPPLLHTLSFFWLMLMITAKYAAREPFAPRLDLLPYLLGPLAEAHQILGLDSEPVGEDTPSPGEKIRLLRCLSGRMSACMAALARLGEEVPTPVEPEARRYLDLIASLLPEG